MVVPVAQLFEREILRFKVAEVFLSDTRKSAQEINILKQKMYRGF